MILSGAMLLRWLGAKHSDPRMLDAAARIDSAVDAVVRSGTATADLGGTATTRGFGDAVIDAILTPAGRAGGQSR